MRASKATATTALNATLDVLGGKWKIFVLSELLTGTKRFGGLRKAIPAVTQKMLTQQLRELEEAGLVQRSVYAEVPPRVDYALTAQGLTLAPVLHALQEWGQRHLEFCNPPSATASPEEAAAEATPELAAELMTKPAVEAAPEPVAEPTVASKPKPAVIASSWAQQVALNHEALTEAIRAAAV